MHDFFRTVVSIEKYSRPISHGNAIMMLGSCFTENISNRFKNIHFNVLCNPTGILYNPISISSALERIMSGQPYRENDLFFHDDLWHSFDHHGRFSHPTISATLEAINTEFHRAQDFLKKTDYLILTAGTAWTYHHKATGTIVANCHRLPNSQFEHQCETSETIISHWKILLQKIYLYNPEIKIILTISPVRHYPAEPRNNQIGKAHCISVFNALEQQFPSLYYFPALEIMMDELRDYRFYDSKMTHPSELAIDYIWKRFSEGCLTERSQQFIKDYSPILHALNHCCSTIISQERHSRFIKSILNMLTDLGNRYPEIDLTHDVNYFQSMEH